MNSDLGLSSNIQDPLCFRKPVLVLPSDDIEDKAHPLAHYLLTYKTGLEEHQTRDESENIVQLGNDEIEFSEDTNIQEHWLSQSEYGSTHQSEPDLFLIVRVWLTDGKKERGATDDNDSGTEDENSGTVDEDPSDDESPDDESSDDAPEVLLNNVLGIEPIRPLNMKSFEGAYVDHDVDHDTLVIDVFQGSFNENEKRLIIKRTLRAINKDDDDQIQAAMTKLKEENASVRLLYKGSDRKAMKDMQIKARTPELKKAVEKLFAQPVIVKPKERDTIIFPPSKGSDKPVRLQFVYQKCRAEYL